LYGLVQFLVGTKSAEWTYENEVRIVRPKKQFEKYRGSVPFKKECLAEVIFGYKANLDEALDLKKKMQVFGYSCNFFKMNLRKDTFGLEKIKI